MNDFILPYEIQNEELEILSELPSLYSLYSVPHLEEKPQNPIIETIRLSRNREENKVLPRVKQEVGLCAQQQGGVPFFDSRTPEPVPILDDIWNQAISFGSRRSNVTIAWDGVTRSSALPAASSSYLSQQSPAVLSATQRMLGGCDQQTTTVSNELVHCIDGMLKGISTPLYKWDPETQRFHMQKAAEASANTLLFCGVGPTATESIMQRFMTIGTLTRRLEAFVTGVWQTSSRIEPAVHSFAHAVSSILEHLKSALANITGSTLHSSGIINERAQSLIRLWSECSVLEEQLETVADLCGCSIGTSVGTDGFATQSAPRLLSRVYVQLDAQLNSGAGLHICAILAFILGAISEDYFDQVCDKVGYNGNEDQTTKTISHSSPFDDIHDNEGEDLPSPEEEEDNDVPCFFQNPFTRALSNARKSLKLLRIAHPGHPLLRSAQSHRPPIRWFWSTPDVTEAWLGLHVGTTEPKPSNHPTTHIKPCNTVDPRYPAEFQDFGRFDLEPEYEAFGRKPNPSYPRNPQFTEFLASFPDMLPSLTPSLSDLTDLILAPLTTHIESLSTALLDTFLSPTSGYLKFSSHLVLLRSFLLLASPSLKNRLEGALFSSYVEESNPETVQSRGRASRAMNTESSWIIGLAPGLMAGRGWPPAGTDLSSLLRTVILDALDHEYPSRQLGDRTYASGNQTEERAIFDEAEWRLGFALRDLPTGSGQARWLDPRSIEALDFLYMNYQAPPALEALISQDTLSKYHRLFVFNIRLLRVEYVVKALFRMSSPKSSPLFHTLTSSQKLFQHFRFVANSFVQALSSYVFDIAIGSNFDAFLHKLTRNDGVDSHRNSHSFDDVFSLAEGHSKLMDDVLSACLMRSAQKPVGDLLRSVLDIVLEFGILMGDLYQAHIQEYEAAGPLEDLYANFKRKMTRLIKVLRALVDKGTMSTRMTFEDMRLQILTGHGPRGVGVTGHLFDLLVRLDAAQWWIEYGRR